MTFSAMKQNNAASSPAINIPNPKNIKMSIWIDKGAFENPVGGRMKFSKLVQSRCNQALFGANWDIQHHFSFCQPENPRKNSFDS